ncbi:protein adenylyltransferase SelO [Sansalvadorimonas verongulae]|uniref:protein adenylyltransferase SelO n=1 Tax=Sansalvadorimonas verongulae TaxID=2172824 RepID=UPI0012BB4E2F|nr:YdiU family protein [Sansalvadorimonas verongulae]MTI14235.1 YdiU family protein [Sansalvadorimonas verongulae]
MKHTYADLGSAFSSPVQPQPLDNPELVSSNREVIEQLSLDSYSQEELTQLCNGSKPLNESSPVAMVYAGHQFGSWVSRLGDGRALLLGELHGADGKLYDLHLKGAGLTPYSRSGDGRAVLRSTIREYLCSEALHHLGIPTTRSLCLINSTTPVYREKTETGAAMIRVAESHVRFGTFEYFSYSKQHEQLQILADYVIWRHFPQWQDDESRVEKLLAEAVTRTAEMIALWQAAGWCHGVMNTDNMSILGHTIDYGPFGFLDGFDAGHICNHSDWQGRYAFNRQPEIGYWNCAALTQALLPILPAGQEKAEVILKTYPKAFASRYSSLLRAKFGLVTAQENDNKLIDPLFTHMQEEKTDYTVFFRALSQGNAEDVFIDRERFHAWHQKYQERLASEGRSEDEVRKGMLAANPKYILRNHLLQIAIDKAESGDYNEVQRLLDIMKKPFDEQPENESYAALPPEWAGELEISCSS